jgi:hypothetical protein
MAARFHIQEEATKDSFDNDDDTAFDAIDPDSFEPPAAKNPQFRFASVLKLEMNEDHNSESDATSALDRSRDHDAGNFDDEEDAAAVHTLFRNDDAIDHINNNNNNSNDLDSDDDLFLAMSDMHEMNEIEQASAQQAQVPPVGFPSTKLQLNTEEIPTETPFVITPITNASLSSKTPLCLAAPVTFVAFSPLFTVIPPLPPTIIE